MPDILIRGMEMPKDDDDYVIFTVYGDGGVVYGPLNRPHVRYKHRAVPLPEGHGRLIDADALLDDCCDVVEDPSVLDYIDPCPMWGYSADMICRAPTIVPAEGGGE